MLIGKLDGERFLVLLLTVCFLALVVGDPVWFTAVSGGFRIRCGSVGWVSYEVEAGDAVGVDTDREDTVDMHGQFRCR